MKVQLEVECLGYMNILVHENMSIEYLIVKCHSHFRLTLCKRLDPVANIFICYVRWPISNF